MGEIFFVSDTIITVKWLAKQAIDEYLVAIFADKWPYGLIVSEESIHKMQQLDIDIDLIAESLFSPSALRSYQQQCLPVKNRYDELINAAEKALDEVLIPATQIFNDASTPIEKACDSLIESAEKKYKNMISIAKKMCPANEMSSNGKTRRAIITIAQKEHDSIVEKAADKYDHDMDVLQEAHDVETTPAFQVYSKVAIAAEKKYSRAKSKLFVECYQEDS